VSIRIRVSACRKESTTKGNGDPAFGSYGAGAAISFEMDPGLMNDPEAFVAKIKEQQLICEVVVAHELVRLKAQSNGNGTHPAAAAPPAKRPVATPPRAAAQVDEEMEEYEQARELPEDDDPPLDGKHLLGWARNQPTDAKGWLIGFGRKKRYPNRILDWTPVQVKTAYDVFRQAHAR
jgi:hypothetical protein